MAKAIRQQLTFRERQVVELIGQGLRGRAIAERLGMAYFTLRKHRLNILRKLDLTTAAQLSAAAAAMQGRHRNRTRISGSLGQPDLTASRYRLSHYRGAQQQGNRPLARHQPPDCRQASS